MSVMRYARGRSTQDNHPQAREAADFRTFARQVLNDRSPRKGLVYICAPFNGDGRRCAEAALPRAWLPVDLDHLTADQLPDVQLWFTKFRFFGYETASSTAEEPRLRIIIELSRPVSRLEGVRIGAAISRDLRDEFGIPADESVYRAEQPVFTPVGDVRPFFGTADSPLDVDLWLASAPDVTELPTVSDTPDGRLRTTVLTGAAGVHDALVALAARAVGRGMAPADSEAALTSLLDAASWRQTDGERWTARRQEIPRIVQSAERKFADTRVERADSDDQTAVYRCLASVAARPVRWLWPGRIPRGKLTLVAGHPGLGKSQLVASLAAVVSSGGRWPGSDEGTPAGAVILLNAEDAADDTIRPRLEAAGADLSRIHELQAVQDGFAASGQPLLRGFRLDRDLPALRSLAARLGQVDLIAVDPITAYLGQINAYSNAEVRAMLAPLSDLAEETGAAVVLISHLNKNSAVNAALLRVSSSIAFTAAARVAYLVERDKEQPKSRRLFLPIKNNLAEDQTGFAFTIEPKTVESAAGPVATSCIAWDPEPVTVTADEAVGGFIPEAERSELEEAKEFLQGYLADGPVTAVQLKQDARAAGLSWASIRRAQGALGIKPQKQGIKGGWSWSLPRGEDAQ